MAGDGGEKHRRAPLGHPRPHRLQQAQAGIEIDLEHAVGLRHLRCDACGVNERADAARAQSFDKVPGEASIRDVRGHGLHLRAHRPQGRRHGLQLFGIEIAQQKLAPTVLRQQMGALGTHSAGRPRNDRHARRMSALSRIHIQPQAAGGRVVIIDSRTANCVYQRAVAGCSERHASSG